MEIGERPAEKPLCRVRVGDSAIEQQMSYGAADVRRLRQRLHGESIVGRQSPGFLHRIVLLARVDLGPRESVFPKAGRILVERLC